MDSPDTTQEDLFDSGRKSITFESHGHCSALLKKLDELRKAGESCDVSLVSQGKRFPCHKAVLIGACDFFRAMFSSNMKESRSSEIELQNIEPDVLECILSFFYTGRIKIDKEYVTSSADIIKAILQTADLFNLPDLKIQCESYLLECINTENCLALHFFARLHCLEHLQLSSQEFMLEHFEEIAQNDELCLLSKDQLISYIKHDRLNTPNEDPVYRAVKVWLEYDWENRKSTTNEVMAHVRFPLCSPQFFLETVEKDMIMSERGCEEYLREFKEYHLVPEKRDSMSLIVRAQPRISQTQQRIVILGGRDSDWKTMKTGWYLDQNKMQWETLCQVPFDNFLFSVCSLNNRAYVTGGYCIPLGTTSDVWEYSGYSQRWIKRADMTMAREDHGSIACSGFVYVMGGTSATERVLVNVERYDPEVNEWTTLADLLTPVFQPAVAAVSSHVYVIGGTKYASHDLRYTTNMGMQVYDSTTNQWSNLASTMFRITGGCAAVLGSRIYLSCGYDKLLCSFDTATKKWEYHSISPTGHCRGRAVMSNGKIMLIGGKYKTRDSRYDWTDAVDVYDPITKAWKSMLSPIPKPLTDFGAVLLNIAV